MRCLVCLRTFIYFSIYARLYLQPFCRGINSPLLCVGNGCWVLRGHLCPYGFHHHTIGYRRINSPLQFFYIAASISIEDYLLFRWYILVVEPSPIFRYRSSAADYPLFHLYYFSTTERLQTVPYFHACCFQLRCRE